MEKWQEREQGYLWYKQQPQRHSHGELCVSEDQHEHPVRVPLRSQSEPADKDQQVLFRTLLSKCNRVHYILPRAVAGTHNLLHNKTPLNANCLSQQRKRLWEQQLASKSPVRWCDRCTPVNILRMSFTSTTQDLHYLTWVARKLRDEELPPSLRRHKIGLDPFFFIFF